jgi:hypothetical protein
VVGVLTGDVFLGVLAGSACISAATLVVKTWTGHGKGT